MPRTTAADLEHSTHPASSGSRLQIGEVAERTGLSLRTIRHYEEVGLLPPAERSAGGFRLYTDATIERLMVIKQMKPLDFTLEQMAELLTARDELDSTDLSPTQRAELENVVDGYRQLVLDKITTLQGRVRSATAFAADLDHNPPQ